MSIFPISSNLRFLLLGLEVLIAFCCFEFAILFAWRFLRRRIKYKLLPTQLRIRNKTIADQFDDYLNILKFRELAWALMFFFISLAYLMFILADFYAGDLITRQFFQFAGYLFYIFGALILIYSLERNELASQHFLFTKIFSILLLAEMLAMMIYIPLVRIIGVIFWPFILIALMKLTKIAILRSQGLRTMAFPTYGLGIGLILLIIGYWGTLDFSIGLMGLVSRLVGDLIEIFGIFIFGLSFYFLPSFAEYEWLEKIRQIFVIHPSGISLFNHNFRPKNIYIESDLTTGAIIAIKSLIEEMNKKGKKLDAIKKDDFTVILGYGKAITVAIIADEDSITLREKCQSFTEDFEHDFQKELDRWFGNVDMFKKGIKLVDKIFPRA